VDVCCYDNNHKYEYEYDNNQHEHDFHQFVNIKLNQHDNQYDNVNNDYSIGGEL
jgi:hypothetical protein